MTCAARKKLFDLNAAEVYERIRQQMTILTSKDCQKKSINFKKF
jgi:hypothetical protein